MKSISVLFMGDSITEGQHIDPPKRWTDIIGDTLAAEYLDSSLNFHFLNKGVSGETSRQGLLRYPQDVQSNHPDLMTLQFGLNDCNYWVTDKGAPRVSLESYKYNLIEMIDRARRSGVKKIIISTNHQTLRFKVLVGGESLEDSRKRYNDAVREVAEETGVLLCDIDHMFSRFNQTEMATLLLPYPDLLHLSEKGHAFYAECIIPVIRVEILNLKRS